MMPVGSLNIALELLKKKQKEYGDSPNTIGPVLEALFPNGIEIQGAEEFARFATFINCVAKINRYANNYETGHKDSAMDLINYAATLHARTE
jgi:hypothetical protein